MSDNKLQFRISSALKNLIGKELITNEYVAVFELVKNAFDAYAKNVEIIFENIYDEIIDNRKLIIKDNGKGMNFNDLNNKWLFVAYSAKTDGTEDISEEDVKDYRNKIKTNRVFAGAKGVGRFSCDRLGTKLNLKTIKDEPKPKIENLIVHWEDFEKDAKEDFININVTHNILSKNPYPELQHGTILEITRLRDAWDREKLLSLKHSLERLINPNQENDTRNFKIKIIAKDEIVNDKEAENERDKVNGSIKNFLLETLDLKTTQIVSGIISGGEEIVTKLVDRGKLIYEIKEKNPYYPFLKSNIVIHLFHLNRSAKYSFTRLMGIAPVQYGSVFLYKNGFRIYPFGEIHSDVLGIDRRKQQGYARFMGTRELLGRIEINDYLNIDDLKETTSRDGGLIKNVHYVKLVDFFFEKALKRLEKYVVDLIKWGEPSEDYDNKEIKPTDITKDILLLISNIAKEDDVIDVKYDAKNLAKILNDRSDENLPKTLKSVEVLADKTNNPELQKKVQKLVAQFREHQIAKKETEAELEKERVEKNLALKDVEQRVGENIFLRSITSTEIKEVASLQHHIERGTDRIERNLKSLKSAVDENSDITILHDYIDRISFEIKKISTISRFITRANFNTEAKSITKDIVEYINEYVNNVYSNYKDIKINNKLLKFSLVNDDNLDFITKFKPLEIVVVVDNLIDNSQKANAKSFIIKYDLDSKKNLNIHFIDDGDGITNTNLNRIFDFGFTTRNGGSGIGLYHVKKIVEDSGGNITVNNKMKKGVEFIIRLTK